MRRAYLHLLLLLLVPAASTALAQGPAPARIPVSAPRAQQIIVQEKALHPEIQKLGLHAVPPGQTLDAIIANNLPDKVGKVSSPSDLQLVAGGQPVAVRKDQGSFFDTFMPLHDRSGAIIGFLVMEVPFTTATTEAAAIQKGSSIRDEVERQVPTLATLFAPAQ